MGFHWQTFMDNIQDIKQAEEVLTQDLAPFCSSCIKFRPAKPIFEVAISELTTTGSLVNTEKEIEPLLVKEKCFEETNYACAELLFLKGLANQLKGSESEAIDDYWQVWSKYPETLYALAAQEKLEPVTQP